MGVEAAVLLSVAGTVKSMSDNAAAARDAQSVMEARARAKRKQADELIKRTEFNNQKLTEEAHTFAQEQQATFAKSGVAVGTGVSLTALADTQERLNEHIATNMREAQYQAEQLEMGAKIDIKTGKNYREAAQRENVTKFLSGVSSVGMSYFAPKG